MGESWTNRSKICADCSRPTFGDWYGSLEAARYFKERDQAGAIINVGSTLSDRALIPQGMYSASKHAVKAFTDGLRMEVEMDGMPISVTLIQPGAVATPYSHHAKNYMETEPTNPPPVYAPETVARTILHCAESSERNVYVGGGGKGIAMLGYYAPRLADLLMERCLPDSNKPIVLPPGLVARMPWIAHPTICESGAITRAMFRNRVSTPPRRCIPC